MVLKAESHICALLVLSLCPVLLGPKLIHGSGLKVCGHQQSLPVLFAVWQITVFPFRLSILTHFFLVTLKSSINIINKLLGVS